MGLKVGKRVQKNQLNVTPKWYCELPGQEIDFNKLEICFGPNIPSYLKEEAAASHGVQLVESHGKQCFGFELEFSHTKWLLFNVLLTGFPPSYKDREQ